MILDGTQIGKRSRLDWWFPLLIVEALLTEMIGVPVKEHCTHGQPSAGCFEVVKPTVVALTPCRGRDRR
jgi:hypothetical protein